MSNNRMIVEDYYDVTIELPQELIRDLTAEAERSGITRDELVVHALKTFLEPAAAPKTGAELVDYWERQGVIGSRPDIEDSQHYARVLRQQAESRNSTD